MSGYRESSWRSTDLPCPEFDCASELIERTLSVYGLLSAVPMSVELERKCTDPDCFYSE
jgi:hypothetical protein